MAMVGVCVVEVNFAIITHCTLRHIHLERLVTRLCEHVDQPSGRIRYLHYSSMDRCLDTGGAYASTFAAEVQVPDR